MNAQYASRTAMVASLTRAIRTRSDPQTIHSDSWGDRIIPGAIWEQFYQFARSKNPLLPEIADETTLRSVISRGLRGSPAYPNIITRSRFAEDALHQAASRGIRQYVIIGAGFDSYALRLPSDSDIVVVEIDHPATQSLKRQWLAQAGVSLPSSTHLIPADLSIEDLASVLNRSLPNISEPVFFSWLGVTMYLPKAANLSTLRALSSTAAPGSELVFEYVDQRFFDPGTKLSGSELALLQAVAALGEPWVCGFNPSSLQSDLASVGHCLLENLSDIDLVRRYDPEGANKLAPSGLGKIALTRVVKASDA
jgi:methyltransferase (TIGR00027 family)